MAEKVTYSMVRFRGCPVKVFVGGTRNSMTITIICLTTHSNDLMTSQLNLRSVFLPTSRGFAHFFCVTFFMIKCGRTIAAVLRVFECHRFAF